MTVRFFYAKGLVIDYNKEKLVKHVVQQTGAHLKLPNSIDIEFQRMGSSTYGETDIATKRITINFDLGLNDIFLPLLHELIHLEQIETGKLARSKEGHYVWESTVYKIEPGMLSYDDYKELPWEQDIVKKHRYLVKELLKN